MRNPKLKKLNILCSIYVLKYMHELMQKDIQLLDLVLAEIRRNKVEKSSCSRCRGEVLLLPGAPWGFPDLTEHEKNGLALVLLHEADDWIWSNIYNGCLSLLWASTFLFACIIYIWILNKVLTNSRSSWPKNQTGIVDSPSVHKIQGIMAAWLIIWQYHDY